MFRETWRRVHQIKNRDELEYEYNCLYNEFFRMKKYVDNHYKLIDALDEMIDNKMNEKV